ncbi:MAG: DNA mismatch repair endonuclease MutL [Fibrobacterota bacterium]
MSVKRIQRLSEATINKIAAGEVVERPSSVVKELLENALDAGATKIILELGEAGKSLIKISDNGSGILRDDAELVFERYATSKIATVDDIYNVDSMGFRGEALSSIAAVADVEILTCTEEGSPATLLEKSPGKPLEVREAARTKGTTLTVRDLFHSVPARRKFLSTDTSELLKITSVFSALAVGNPGTAFRLISDGREKSNLAATDDPVRRIGDVFGETLVQSLLSAEHTLDNVTARVHFSNLDYTRGNRTGQLYFVNRRLVENRNLERGLRIGYKDLLPPGRFPVVFAFLTVAPGEIDVNVHPAKKEIRFADEETVIRAMGRAIQGGFRDKSVVRNFAPNAPFSSEAASLREDETVQVLEDSAPVQSEMSFDPDRSASGPDTLSGEAAPGALGPRQLLIPYFQLHDTYILCQIKKGLLIIDQHVAHERILYERALKSMQENETPVTQQLLFPVTLELSLSHAGRVEAFQGYFTKMGFSLRRLSGNTVVVDGVPAAHSDKNVKDMMLEILDTLAQQERGDVTEADKRFARSYSCGAAIKAGQPLTLEEINTLVDQLFQCDNPYTCPHGRPVVIQLPLDEIHRRFFR